MPQIAITRGLSAEISETDAERVQRQRWHAVPARGTFYAAAKVDGRTTYMHRVVLGVTDPDMHVDHIDGNGLNNKRENLRVCSKAENARKRKTSGSATGVRGVYLQRGRHIARIGHGGKFHYLGTFDSAEAASAAYRAAAQQMFGQFAPQEIA